MKSAFQKVVILQIRKGVCVCVYNHNQKGHRCEVGMSGKKEIM